MKWLTAVVVLSLVIVLSLAFITYSGSEILVEKTEVVAEPFGSDDQLLSVKLRTDRKNLLGPEAKELVVTHLREHRLEIVCVYEFNSRGDPMTLLVREKKK
ncbi:hypothetical protein HZA87_01005 [Candidatus Uhrbacteria bacterium]|nr:hypothetical protein [Candidatus Uhrbacteria bacterium]